MSTQSTTTTAGRAVAPIPTSRIVRVELRKMFDTRSGFWLLTSTGLLSVVATAAAIVFAPEGTLSYDTFATAIGFPMTLILPLIAILAVTSEWSQRSGLTTFTLVPGRGRVIGAKAMATVIVGIVSMLAALLIGAVGNVVGSALAGVDTVWDISPAHAAEIVMGNLVGMAIGFTLGVVLRSSAAAVVGYFVLSFVLSGILVLLARAREWFTDLQAWIDWNQTQVALFEGRTSSAQEWAQLASTTLIWIVVPLVVGLALLRRCEVK
ncbi:ABC transporter permease [Nocardioides daeguensis]|uniref:ABC transporter permease n=1 Tax=Nocardioides daeguensis TaxID=908359 RepID=A0ABP6WBM6_9ACTN|nr:ABC transporter permease subunit [Nocardioides daeguensis]MBV6728090.1 ABC transporter permease [Nocardioides daeguensis]MCR1774164.1 ABC transporter permease [Nocardioides daeguensis]